MNTSVLCTVLVAMALPFTRMLTRPARVEHTAQLGRSALEKRL